MNDFSSFSDRLRYLLKENNLTQVQLAQQLGISKYALTNYVTGARLPETTILYAISKYFNKSMEWLLSGQNDFADESPALTNQDTRDMINTIELMMNDADPEIRAWAKIQFKKTFREYFDHATKNH